MTVVLSVSPPTSPHSGSVKMHTCMLRCRNTATSHPLRLGDQGRDGEGATKGGRGQGGCPKGQVRTDRDGCIAYTDGKMEMLNSPFFSLSLSVAI